MQGARTYAVENASDDGEAVASFLAQYYAKQQIPDEVVVQEFCETELIEGFFPKNSTAGRSPCLRPNRACAVSSWRWQRRTLPNISIRSSTRSATARI